MADAKQLQADLGVRKQIWLTEFQAGLDPPNHCLMPEFIFGALHGSFHAARIIAAINQPGDYAVLTWQTFMSPVDYPRCEPRHLLQAGSRALRNALSEPWRVDTRTTGAGKRRA